MLTALEKLPADRFATAAEFADALTRPVVRRDGALPARAAAAAAAAAPPARRRLGVLVPALGAGARRRHGGGAVGLAPTRGPSGRS